MLLFNYLLQSYFLEIFLCPVQFTPFELRQQSEIRHKNLLNNVPNSPVTSVCLYSSFLVSLHSKYENPGVDVQILWYYTHSH